METKSERPTAELLNELEKREAVEQITVIPYQSIEIIIDGKPAKLSVDSGPARILLVWD